jgi:uncharacterized protein (DUF924 family)
MCRIACNSTLNIIPRRYGNLTSDGTTDKLAGMTASDTLATPTDILDFWLADGVQLGWPTQDMSKRWFGGGAALDDDIKLRFGPRVLQALDGQLGDWTHAAPTPALGQLAHVILIDQFTRNVFRGQARAFSGDALAQQLVLQAIAAKADEQLPWVGRIFLYMPLMHAEKLSLQTECVARFAQLVEDAPEDLKERLQGNLDFARQHADIIARFGRFPYRNTALGRASTAEEELFLSNGPRFGQ